MRVGALDSRWDAVRTQNTRVAVCVSNYYTTATPLLLCIVVTILKLQKHDLNLRPILLLQSSISKLSRFNS